MNPNFPDPSPPAGAAFPPAFAEGAVPLDRQDPEVFRLIQLEKKRQVGGLEFIASENFTSKAVLEALGTCLTNKYSEGYAGARYYGGTPQGETRKGWVCHTFSFFTFFLDRSGNEVIDQVETLCISRALAAFRLSSEQWGVNVQPYSGSPANFAVLTALLKPHDRLMGLALSDGGHLTHGHQTAAKKVSVSSIYFESLSYGVDLKTGRIDYDGLRATALNFRPKLLIAGSSAYPRDWDYARMRAIADEVGAFLMADMAHVSGLVAGGEQNDPFPHCDVVTTTTHKSLRGPRSGMIFFRRGTRKVAGAGAGGDRVVDYADLESKINFAVFPSCQGGPHENVVAAVAVALGEVLQPSFKEYARNVRLNATALAKELMALRCEVVTGGTDNHIVLWDLRAHQLTGSKMEKLLQAVHISVNKNTIPGDVNAVAPSGIRLGTPAMTTRGMTPVDMAACAGFLDRALKIALVIQATSGKALKDFEKALEGNADVKALALDVEAYGNRFPMPGHMDR